LLCASPAFASAEPAVSVRTILAAYDRATHAAETQTYIAEGTIAGEGLTGAFHSWRDGDREREDETLGPRRQTTLRIGDRIFVRNANGNVRELQGYLHRRSLTEKLIDTGTFVAHPELTRFAGWATFDGNRAWRLEVSAPGGEPETLWIDPQSGLPLRLEYLDGDGPSYVDYSDWHTVHGRKIAFRSVETDGEHAFDIVQQITSVTIDAPVDPALFAPLHTRTIGTNRVHVVPLLERDGHVGTMVRIAGRDWFFLLDTGSQSVLVDNAVLRAAGIEASGAMEVRGAARSGGLRTALLPRASIDGATMNDLVVATLDIGESLRGLHVDGILGYPFFASALVEMDFAHHVLRFGPPGSFVPTGTKLALDVDRELAEATARVGDRIEAPFIVDTGNSAEMLLYRPFLESHPGLVPPSTIAAWNFGLGGQNAAYRTQLDALTLGGVTLYHRDVNVVLATQGAFADRIDAGNLGLGTLRNFDLTFDLGAAALYLQPGASFDDGRRRIAHNSATHG
jgi:predicted aspartyl protease